MNYRHVYHAGNFADVFKHIVLVALTQSFLRKESAFCYIDTHAGIGLYNLTSDAAQKNKEYETGIVKLLAAENPPELIRDYLNCVKEFNPSKTLEFYPGSPLIVETFLRRQDRMILSELQTEDHLALKNLFHIDKRVAVHHQDAYQNLRAFIPPKEKRGLVLIDPPYEKPEEIMKLPKYIADSVKRWETGIFAIWYPIKHREAASRLRQEIQTKLNRPYLITELSIYPETTSTHLNGSGMFIVNPPWQLNEKLKSVLPWLWKTLSVNHQGRYE
jgi:23S rRNA (adenine2030-N6)-methyltransferase